MRRFWAVLFIFSVCTLPKHTYFPGSCVGTEYYLKSALVLQLWHGPLSQQFTAGRADTTLRPRAGPPPSCSSPSSASSSRRATWGSAPSSAPPCSTSSSSSACAPSSPPPSSSSPGGRPGLKPSESDPLPNPSESGIHFCRFKMPIQTVKYGKAILCGAARNPPEFTRIRPLPNPSESGDAIPVVGVNQSPRATSSTILCRPSFVEFTASCDVALRD